MILIWIDILILIILLVINYKKYQFSTEFNRKQNTELVTLVVIIVLYGMTIPFLGNLLASLIGLKKEPFRIYYAYTGVRLQLFWCLGALQILYLFWINLKIKNKTSKT